MIDINNFLLKSKRDIFNSDNYFGLKVESPQNCPLCGFAIYPEVVSCIMIDSHDRLSTNYDKVVAKISFYCINCGDVFLGNYKVIVDEYTEIGFQEAFYPTTLMELTPKKHIEVPLDDAIAKISPMFVKIFNQAAFSESLKLDEISGISYRKSLEFLIKDFAIYMHPEKKNNISSFRMSLSECINTYIDNESIKQLARASTYLGNDQSHYQKRHHSKDIEDLKKLITALVYYINMSLTLFDSDEITSK